MTCREFVEIVTDYFEGALPDEDVQRVEAHVDICHGCTRYLEQMRVTITTVARIDADSISDNARATLLAAFSDWSGGERPLP